jgi:flagellar FliL protein
MAKDKKEELDEPKEQEEPKKKKPKLKLMIIASIAVAVIAAGAAGGYYFFVSKKASAAPQAQTQQPATLSIWPMDAFVVNIADVNGERYLKLVIQLEISDPGALPELEQLKPRLRDSILDLLTPKTYKDLMDLAGKQRLREDIAGRVNNILSKGKVTRVYFTDFVIQ